MKMRLVDGFVTDLSDDPGVSFHPTIAAEFVDVPKGAPDELRSGYRLDGKTWTAPVEPVVEAPIDAPAFRTVMTPIRFKAQFSVEEQVDIKRARAYIDGSDTKNDVRKAFNRDALEILFGSLDDPRLTEVDVADPAISGGIDFVQSVGILTPERAAAIKRGISL